MRPPIEFLFPPELASQLIYSFVIIICSLMIYYSTREMYELSSYKGIKYFRLAFLFFAIAYFFRYFVMFFLTLVNDLIAISPELIFPVSLFIFMYSSSMAVFYLLYSVMWKRWNNEVGRMYFFNALALIIAFLGILFRERWISLLLNVIFFLFAAFILFVAYKDSKKNRGRGLLGVYLLLFIFFFLNIIDTLIPKFWQPYSVGIYIISILLFMAILYRVLRKVGN